jgi:Na+-driven multidrug efflux pump
MAGERSVLREGITGGLLGAAAVAVWFLVFDTFRGKPLLTPALLGAAVFSGAREPETVSIALGPILGYTILHGLAFIAFGVIAAALIAISEREPTLFIAVIILFACFEMFFLGALGALGRSMVGALVWWSILVGNLLAAVVMLWYFFLGHRALPRTLIGPWGGVLQEGAVAGFLGAAIVAIWFLAIDTIRGEPFRTPELLATAFLRQTEPVAAVLSYTVVHGFAFLVFGILASLVVAAAERQPVFVLFLIITFTVFEVAAFCAIIIAANWVLNEVAGWTIFVANLLASGAMLAYFFRRHRTLAHRFTDAWADEA